MINISSKCFTIHHWVLNSGYRYLFLEIQTSFLKSIWANFISSESSDGTFMQKCQIMRGKHNSCWKSYHNSLYNHLTKWTYDKWGHLRIHRMEEHFLFTEDAWDWQDSTSLLPAFKHIIGITIMITVFGSLCQL